MRTVIIALLVALLGLALSGCDDRTNEKPDMTFTSDKTELTNTDDALNYCTLTIVLEGDDGVTHNEKINFTYEPAQGTLIGNSGSSVYAHTDSTGVATAIFTVTDSAYGNVIIDAAMDKFPSVHDTLRLFVIDTPEITYSTMLQSETPGDGIINMAIEIQLTSSNDGDHNNTSNQKVYFSSGLDIQQDSLYTDAEGKCTNLVEDDSVVTDTYSTHVWLESYPNVEVTILSTFVDP